MIPFLRSIPWTILFGLVSLHSLSADDEQISITFRTYPVASTGELRELHFEASPGRFEPLRFRRFQRSIETFTYEGPPVLTFYRPDETMETGFAPVAKAAIPAESGPFLVFVLPRTGQTEEDPSTLTLALINDSFEHLPDDTVSFINFTNAPLVGVIDVVRLELGPGLTGPFSLHERLGKPVTVGLAVRRGDTFRKVLQNSWTFRAGERNLVILAPPRRPGSYRIQAFHLIDGKEEAALRAPF